MAEEIRKVQRDGNVEAFRCLLMFLIVAYHTFLHSPFSGSKALWTVCFTTLICWHVDGFLAIGGWFGMKFRWRKIFRIVGHMVFYGVLSCLYCWIVGAPLRSPVNYFFGAWFGASYLTLMFLAPAINWMLDKKVGKVNLGMFFVWTVGACLFASWVTGRFGKRMVPVQSFGIYSVSLMVFIYGFMQFLRKALNGRSPRLCMLLLGAVTFVALMPTCRLCDIAWQHVSGRRLSGIGAYFAAFDAPHTMMMATVLLLLFVYYIRLPHWLGCSALKLSPLIFGVYLCHATTSFGNRFYEIFDYLPANGFVAVLCAAIFVFGVSLGIEALRKLAVCFVIKVVRR